MAVKIPRCCLRVLVIMMQQAAQAKITIRASALTYTVILSMVPVLAMSTAILKGMGSGDQLRIVAERFIQQLAPPGHQQQPDVFTDPSTSGLPVEGNGTMTIHLQRAVDTIFDYVDNTNFAALGAFGVAGLFIVIIMVFSAVEDAMNAIWKTTRGRPIIRKVMDYIALLVLFPISVNMALAGEAILASDKIMGYVTAVIPLPWLIKALFKFLPFLIIVLTLMTMYLFFSRARVTTRAAFAGAVFASLFWFIIQKAYILLQIGVSNYNAIYGSFATVPLFLAWLHLGWIFILLGASLAYAVQHRKDHPLEKDNQTPQRTLQLAFDITRASFLDHSQRRLTTLSSLEKKFPTIHTSDLERVTNLLVSGGIFRKADGAGTTGYIPATTVAVLKPEEIVDLVFGNEHLSSQGGEMAGAALIGAREALKPYTLDPSTGAKQR